MRSEIIWIILLFELFFVSLFLIFTGYHNIDNAWNLDYVEHNTDMELVDNSLFLNQVDKVELYRIGIMQTMIGLMVIIPVTFILGLIINKNITSPGEVIL